MKTFVHLKVLLSAIRMPKAFSSMRDRSVENAQVRVSYKLNERLKI